MPAICQTLWWAVGIKWCEKKKKKNIALVLVEFTVEEETEIEQVITKPVWNYSCAQ